MQTITPAFPYPIFFVVRDTARWPELFHGRETEIPHPDSLHSRIQTNEDCWAVLTYLRLKQRGLNVFVSDRFIPGEICVASTLDFGLRDRPFNSFVVGCRSDGFRPYLCNFTIVQNQLNVEFETDVFIPHWPQPGLIPRCKERNHRIENIVFKGFKGNLYKTFYSTEFLQELEKLEVTLKIHGREKDETLMWHDYRTDDIVLAVRDLTEKDALVKPASKLVNAWLAGVPALLGPEPAFRDMRRSPLDYIEVTTPQAAIAAIQRLKAQPELYQLMVTNGHKRAEDFTVDCMVKRWYDVLSGPVTSQYKLWKKETPVKRMAMLPLKVLQHKRALQEASYNRYHGYRLISDQYT